MEKLKTLEELYAERGIVAPPRNITNTSAPKVIDLIPILEAFRLLGLTTEDLLRLSVAMTQDKGFKDDVIKRIREI